MNFLRKIGKWCWDKKERMALAVMLLVLGYRVYSVINVDAAGTIGLPNKESPIPGPPEPYPDPPKLKIIVEKVDVPIIARRQIFEWVRPGTDDTGSEINEEDRKLKVIRIIIKEDGNHLAQISTGGKKTLLAVGASFESYQLVSITLDLEDGKHCCEIYSENSNRNIEVCVK